MTAVRTYTFGGGPVATRTPDGVSYLGGDQAGSVETQIASEDDVTATRSYTPYGRVRAETGDLDTDQGFLGQIEDPTGLSYLNARYYDTTNGIFISPDPLYDPARPKSQNPYAYAHGNPATLSDPSGLWIPVSNSNSPTFGWDARVNGGRGGFIGNPYTDTGINRSQARRYSAVQTRQRNEYRWTVVANRNRNRHVAEMRSMCSQNCNPSFWHALAAAGSGGNLVLIAMCMDNCEAGFWRFMGAAGSLDNVASIVDRIERGLRGNAIAGNFDQLIDLFIGPAEDRACGGADDVVLAYVQANCYNPSVTDPGTLWDLLRHIDFSVTVPVIASNPRTGTARGCVGGGFQGGHFYTSESAGACGPGVSGGVTGQRYEDRNCDSIVVGANSQRAAGVYGSVGVNRNGVDRHDWELGISLGDAQRPTFAGQHVQDGRICRP